MVEQVGGSHYAGGFQHWDLIIQCKTPYLEANATKYLTRYRKKNGKQDLEKALSYVRKMKSEIAVLRPRVVGRTVPTLFIKSFLDKQDDMSKKAKLVFNLLLQWSTEMDLTIAEFMLLEMILEEYPEAPTSTPQNT